MKGHKLIISLYIILACIVSSLNAQEKNETSNSKNNLSEFKHILGVWINYYSIYLSDFELKNSKKIEFENVLYNYEDPMIAQEFIKNQNYSIYWLGAINFEDNAVYKKQDSVQYLELLDHSNKTKKRIFHQFKTPFIIEKVIWLSKGFIILAIEQDKSTYNFHINLYNLTNNTVKEYQYSTKYIYKSELYFYINLISKDIQIEEDDNPYIDPTTFAKIYDPLGTWLNYYSLDLSKFRYSESSVFNKNISDNFNTPTYMEYSKEDAEFTPLFKEYSKDKNFAISWIGEMLNINEDGNWIYLPNKTYYTYFYNNNKQIVKNITTEKNYSTSEGVFWIGNEAFILTRFIGNLNRLDHYKHVIEYYNLEDNTVKKYYYDSKKIYIENPFFVENLKNKGINLIDY